jgi:hypothetical protein
MSARTKAQTTTLEKVVSDLPVTPEASHAKCFRDRSFVFLVSLQIHLASNPLSLIGVFISSFDSPGEVRFTNLCQYTRKNIQSRAPTREWTGRVLSFIFFTSKFYLRFVYLPGSADLPPDGFLTSLSYVCNSLDAQNHSAISHFGSSLWSFGGLTQTFVYDLGSSMTICCWSVS